MSHPSKLSLQENGNSDGKTIPNEAKITFSGYVGPNYKGKSKVGAKLKSLEKLITLKYICTSATSVNDHMLS